ncbi:MAG: hypothetical protein JO246_01320 [Frankiaceae bacterium]|nr:hypothetical protein [Frankiaceae bacterium]MBV9870989.1 hypothetical protein [Frankiaceae bacterium]
MTDDHLSLDDLAELDEGLLPPERTSAVRAHLHGCSQCQARATSIADVRGRLANLPPVTMPADVKARMDQAIAAERDVAAGSASHAGEDEEAPSAAVVDLSSRTPDVMPARGSVKRPAFGRPSMPAIAVAATFVLAGGAIIIGHANHSSSDGASSGGASVTAGQEGGQIVLPESTANLTLAHTGTTYTTTDIGTSVQGLLGAASTLDTNGSAQPTVGESPTPGPSDGVGGGAAQSTGGARASKSAKASRKRSQPHRSSAPVTSSGSLNAAGSGASAKPIPKALKPLATSRNKILDCARNITGELDAVPLTVDFARWSNPPVYKHAPSAIFIFRSPKPNTVVVYVTNPSCSGNDIVREFAQVPLP